ncbi:signal peptidase II [Lentzea tibetensis]|uniref:Lipoprotein signal peptidase n=2 Tax=Lentzea tibetensis TaxID=2591470 RepID=A0A563ES05_9PSEU|nr:signal peptidase II [Lentzea tibetensis]
MRPADQSSVARSEQAPADLSSSSEQESAVEAQLSAESASLETAPFQKQSLPTEEPAVTEIPELEEDRVEASVAEAPVEESQAGELRLDDELDDEPAPKPKAKSKAKPEKPADDEPFESFGGGSLAGELPIPRTKLLSVIAAIVLGLDLLTKVAAVAFLEQAAPIKLFGGVLYLSFVRNPGAAFGLAEGMTWVLALIALGVVGFILWISRNLRSLGWAIGLGGVLGGALGNLFDRIFRTPGPMRGHVVDFLSLLDPYGRVWPVFNVADMAIVCGGGLIVYMALRQHDYDGTVHKKKVSV